MIDAMTEIATKAGRMDAFVTHPQEGGPFPAVVIFMDIWGLREELFDIARKVATVGYHCTVPNLYYRQGPVRFEKRDRDGRMVSFKTLSAEERERMMVQRRALTDEMVIEDAGALLDFLRTQPITPGPKGSIGYCMGGRHALCVAAAYPDDFRATVSLHGTLLVSDSALSPHKLGEAYRGEIYCGFGERDEHVPQAWVAALAQALEGRSNVAYRYQVHRGADHGYPLPDRDIYDKHAANRDWEIIFRMFGRVLATQSGIQSG
jgi:carboxymethylenebutenolidase